MPYNQLLIRNENGTSNKLYSKIESKIYRQAKIKILVYKGKLNNYLSKDELVNAKKFGYLPNRFNVHHIIPLCCENTRLECDNLVICSKEFHTWLHKYVYDPALLKLQKGQKVTLYLPDWKDVNTMDNLDKKYKDFYEHRYNKEYAYFQNQNQKY